MPRSPPWTRFRTSRTPIQLLQTARLALGRGRPWQASLLITPVVEDSAQRTPPAVFLAATAASRWGGWPEVGRLLQGEAWLDSLFEGRGRILLARSALERGADSLALEYALAAPKGTDAESEGERLLLLASALDRVNARDSAAASYKRAAAVLPLVSDWVLLRAASVTDDSAARALIYQRINGDLPRERFGMVEAQAHQRTGDLDGAARRYQAMGNRLAALRLRLQMTADSAPRQAIRLQLLKLVTGGGSTAEVKGAIVLLDSVYAPLSNEEELLVAQSAGDAGLAARAAAGYEVALKAGIGGQVERYGYAEALAKIGRHADAAAQAKLVKSPAWMAASAAYLRARSLVRDGQVVEGRAVLVEIGTKYPKDTTAASSALFLWATSPRMTAPTAWRARTTGAPRSAFPAAASPPPPASAPRWWSCSPVTPAWPAASSTSWPDGIPRATRPPPRPTGRVEPGPSPATA